MASSISLPRVESGKPLLNAIRIVPGILLLAGIGYAAKILEHSVNAYAKARHWTFPNIEYVLWAILIGLVISNTLSISVRYRHLRVLAKTWHCASGRKVCSQRRDETRRHQPRTRGD
jgi:uncharacterized membrane protein